MKSHTQYLTFNTKTRREFVNITPQVTDAVRKSGVQEGLCLVNAMHITSSVFINDDEKGLHKDFINYEKVNTFRSFGGIRIEDDVLVASTGTRVLGPGIPKTIQEVEAACENRMASYE